MNHIQKLVSASTTDQGKLLLYSHHLNC